MKDNGCGQPREDIQLRLWLKMYDECQSQRRHHETARANLSMCIITANTAIFGFAVQGYLNGIYACAMIMFLSLIDLEVNPCGNLCHWIGCLNHYSCSAKNMLTFRKVNGHQQSNLC